MSIIRKIAVAVPAVALLALPAVAEAGARLFDNSVSTCTTNDCSSQVFGGTVTNPASNNDPWVIQVFAAAGECLRLRVLEQAVDLETTVVAPNGSVFRNDDGGLAPCTLCSLVKFAAPNRGWYTVQVNHFGGTASYSDLQIAYGRYSAGNPNCAAPTPPAFAAAERAAKSGASAPVSGTGTR